MGSGNWLPSKRDTLLDWDGFYVAYEGIYGDRYFEEEMYDTGEIEEFISYIVEELKIRFDELYDVDQWRSNNEKVLLQHDIIKLVIGENDNSAAVYFILEDPQYVEGYFEDYDEDEEFDTEAYVEKYREYLDALKDILTAVYVGNVYKRDGAWSSIKIG